LRHHPFYCADAARREIEKPFDLPARKPRSGPLLQPADMKRFDFEIFFYPE
jgi:hypothetical protein